jgi:glycerol-3-phosphate acyltransferase PlsY
MAIKIAGLAIAYLVGAIPVGLMISRAFFHVDIRQHGSGNIGTTNVFRTLGKGPAALTLVGDVCKGWLGVWIAQQLGNDPGWGAVGGLAVLGGSCWSVFLGFKGGKGVATGFGVFLRLAPLAVLPAVLIWIVVAAGWRYVSLASMTASLCLPLGTLLLGYPGLVFLTSLVSAAIVIARHRDNLARLFQGTERKVGNRVSA